MVNRLEPSLLDVKWQIYTPLVPRGNTACALMKGRIFETSWHGDCKLYPWCPRIAGPIQHGLRRLISVNKVKANPRSYKVSHLLAATKLTIYFQIRVGY